MVEGFGLQRMLKAKALIIRVNLLFLAFFLLIYVALLLRRPSSSFAPYSLNAASFVSCSLRECHPKMKAVLEETEPRLPLQLRRNMTKLEIPMKLWKKMGKSIKIGMVNLDEEDISEWEASFDIIHVGFEKVVSKYFEWKDLFPEWVDEEEDLDGASCPEIPLPDYRRYQKVDMIVAKLPCRYPEEGWGRDVFRLQIHLIAANMAAKKGKRDWFSRTKVAFLSKCRPMMELFQCNDLIGREGDWWFYEPEMSRLEQKVSLPIGSCKLSMPIWDRGVEKVYDLSKIQRLTKTVKREAYATVIHSSEAYVCGAITLAQSLLQTGTKRHLILLMDDSISMSKRAALVSAGWNIRIITRIRNPRAEKDSYNEYNYSKFRLWQLTDYDKIIFIDSDIIVLRNLDLLFHFPQMSAVGNDNSIFNSGIMVIEPSNCTFRVFMERRDEIVSYNGGDQGFLNEVFVWWHRLPRRTNFLKNFWSNTTLERSVKNEMFGADPPKLYAIHYLGLKPWLCYRDYDCNWNIDDQRVYASDVAHQRWWKLHDAMDEKLQSFCKLTERRRIELDWDRKMAKNIGYEDQHWNINITDPRRIHLV
ncbi:UDP-glucuronate:xylan alpha-glucuronosyltransferase 2 isoform X1 [Cucumis melo var. makuwa]|uniref:Hexosyltransferase n=1 Tax=Cucumis melo var. makuwa TaxID=1194695 RepID=A0A5A7V0P4_CUCMM|nr:UDP-glucuronate:xylan alpha-glucuronosyltransferase 2 isoform X1 [Cucumis melo var. makuwa]